MFALLAALALAAGPADEARYLSNVRQLTRDYVRAGEGYFSPDGKRLIFQRTTKSDGCDQIFFDEH